MNITPLEFLRNSLFVIFFSDWPKDPLQRVNGLLDQAVTFLDTFIATTR